MSTYLYAWEGVACIAVMMIHCLLPGETGALMQTLADELHEKYGVEIITPDDTIREATIPYIQPLIEDWDLIQSMA